MSHNSNPTVYIILARVYWRGVSCRLATSQSPAYRQTALQGRGVRRAGDASIPHPHHPLVSLAKRTQHQVRTWRIEAWFNARTQIFTVVIGRQLGCVWSVTRLRSGQPRLHGSILGRRKRFFSSKKCPDWFLEAPPPFQPPIQWAPGPFSPGVKRSGLDANRLTPSSDEVKN